MTNKVFFNPSCSKCRIAGKFMDENNIIYSKYEYLKEGITKEDILKILDIGNLTIDDILRTGEAEYKENILGKDLSDDERIAILVKFPRILQRPIVLSDGRAIVARDSESLAKLI